MAVDIKPHEQPDKEVVRRRRAARATQIVDYVFIVVYALIAIEILLELAGARDSNAFKRMIDGVSAPFLAPFRGLFSDPSIEGYHIMFSYLAALIVWMLVHLGIRGLIRLIANRRTTM